MENMSEGMPIIIDDTTSFICFSGIVKGKVIINIYDGDSEEFDTHISVKTNLGSGGLHHNLKSDENIKKKIKGISIRVTISKWSCTAEKLCFHVKATAKYGLAECTPLNKTMTGKRHDADALDSYITEALQNLEA